VRAHTYTQLFAAARLIAPRPNVRGERLAIIANGRDPDLMAADTARDSDVPLAVFSPETVTRLDALLPPESARENALNLGSAATPERFADALGAVIDDPGTDAVLALHAPVDQAEARGALEAMVQTAAHLVEEVFPRQPVRQWVLSIPKRLRYFLQHDPAVVSSVLHIFLRVVEETLRQSSPGAGSGARFGAVSFLHRFGSALNAHVHFHCCVIDGVFQPDVEGRLRFYPALGLTQERIAKAQGQVRRRIIWSAWPTCTCVNPRPGCRSR
jgi:hypothetical protein